MNFLPVFVCVFGVAILSLCLWRGSFGTPGGLIRRQEQPLLYWMALAAILSMTSTCFLLA